MLTYTKIATVTVGSGGSATMSFSNIPQTFTDLKLVMSTRGGTAGSGDNILVSINSSSTTFTFRQLYGTGSAAGSVSGSYAAAGYSTNASSTASTFASTEIYIPGYTSGNYKSFSVDTVTENNATAATSALTANLWSTVSAITSLSFSQQYTGNFQQYSSATLYGIGYKPQATGGSISSDGTYWYHAFTSTGLFTPSKNLQCDVLVVAGGGGAGGGTTGSYGGGGGGGGMLTSTGYSTKSGVFYAVAVGAGGIGGTINTNPRGGSGDNSVFGTLTAVGGGGGGSGNYGNFPNAIATGGDGGSGGGSGYAAIAVAGGTGTSGQGNNGASYNAGGQAGGGGGKGSAGSTNTGGTGASSSYSGSAVTYAAGGSGGGSSTNANATANTGNGGDINTSTRYGMNGGSGVVIVRYKI